MDSGNDNPAGVFSLTAELSADTLTAIQVNGTLIIPSGEPLTMQGIIHIEPKKNFPALISLKHLNLTLIGNLEKFSKSLEKNRIEGFMYVLGNVLITANDAPGELLYGSLFADDIRIVANPLVKMTYDPKIFSNPPPGIDFIDFGAWREVF